MFCVLMLSRNKISLLRHLHNFYTAILVSLLTMLNANLF
uniref:Uncharacterized protein n=1 Tax=Arundo donax TaxID=35708 RepID=A0A0A9A6A3_ARUDO